MRGPGPGQPPPHGTHDAEAGPSGGNGPTPVPATVPTAAAPAVPVPAHHQDAVLVDDVDSQDAEEDLRTAQREQFESDYSRRVPDPSVPGGYVIPVGLRQRRTSETGTPPTGTPRSGVSSTSAIPGTVHGDTTIRVSDSLGTPAASHRGRVPPSGPSPTAGPATPVEPGVAGQGVGGRTAMRRRTGPAGQGVTQPSPPVQPQDRPRGRPRGPRGPRASRPGRG